MKLTKTQLKEEIKKALQVKEAYNPHTDYKLGEMQVKLLNTQSMDGRIKLVYQWIKTNHMDIKQFREILDNVPLTFYKQDE